MNKKSGFVLSFILAVLIIGVVSASWWNPFSWGDDSVLLSPRCTDTDNGVNYSVKGITFAASTNYSDSCSSNNRTLKEYYCYSSSSSTRIYSKYYSCPTGCKDGACISNESVPAPVCNDSDGGKNIYLLGITTSTKSNGGLPAKDQCSLVQNNVDSPVSSCAGSGCMVRELSCSEEEASKGMTVSESINCSYGCENGVCLPAPTCTDSDGGVNYSVRGQIEIKDASGKIISSDWDDCDEEFFCNANGTAGIVSPPSCLYGCFEGVCLPAPVCNDSDGGLNYEVKGLTNGKSVFPDEGVTSKTDYCIQKNPDGLFQLNQSLRDPYLAGKIASCSQRCAVQEYSCSTDTIVSDIVDCPNGCKEGRCLNLISVGFDGVCKLDNLPVGSSDVCVFNGESYIITNLGGCGVWPTNLLVEYQGSKFNLTLDQLNESNSFILPNGVLISNWGAPCSQSWVNIHFSESTKEIGTTCNDVVDLISNPTDFKASGIKWTLNWNNSWISDYDGRKNYYAAFSGVEENYNYGSSSYASISLTSANADEIVAEFNNLVEYNLCVQREFGNNTVYICVSPWDIAQDSKNLNAENSKSKNIYWFKDNLLFSIYTYTYEGQDWNCFDDASCARRDAYFSNLDQENLIDSFEKLIDNKPEYVWDFNIPWKVESLVQFLLERCNSQVDSYSAESCQSSWYCKLEPAICPPHGYQNQICTRSCNDKQEVKENQMDCSPGICAGCMVPKWFGGNALDNKCIPYGFRFEQDSGNFEWINYSHTSGGYQEETESITVAETLEYGGDPFIEITPENTMFFRVQGWDNVTYTLAAGSELDLLKILNYSFYDGEYKPIKYVFKINKVYYDSANYSNSYFEYTVIRESPETTHNYSYQEPIMFNMYCDMDGRVKQQKTPTWDNEWARCQNNYECDSNLCSSGECIEVQKMLDQASGMKSVAVRVLCKLAHLLNDDNYNTCLYDFLGSSYVPASESSSSGGGGGGSSKVA